MGRAPCCDKANVKKGPWSPEEDAKLKSYIDQHGTGGNWIALPQKIGLKRCGKSCRLRWLNYLRPNIKHGGFSEEEDNIICSLYISIGSRWSIIAAQLPGRTDNDIKNYWNTRLKKKLLGNKQRKDQQARRGTSTSGLIKQETTRRGTTSTTTSTNITGILNSNNLVPSADYNIIHTNNLNPYWPELPILTPAPYSNDSQPCYNDHSSIRKLLIKLGGRFSDDHDDYNQPLIHDVGETGPHVPSSASAPQPAFGNSVAQFAQQVQYNTDNYGFMGPQMLEQGQSSSSTSQLAAAELDHQDNGIYNNVPAGAQVIDGLEFLYGEDSTTGNDKIGGIINGSSTTTTTYGTADISWGEMSSMVYNTTTTPNFVSDYQSAQESCLF